jgi:hypothetical protein
MLIETYFHLESWLRRKVNANWRGNGYRKRSADKKNSYVVNWIRRKSTTRKSRRKLERKK